MIEAKVFLETQYSGHLLKYRNEINVKGVYWNGGRGGGKGGQGSSHSQIFPVRAWGRGGGGVAAMPGMHVGMLIAKTPPNKRRNGILKEGAELNNLFRYIIPYSLFKPKR